MIISEIIGIFLSEFNRELTINQIAKELKKSYASVNGHCNKLIKCGMLNKKIVGSAILCSLNFDNVDTFSYVVQHSLSKQKHIPRKFDRDDVVLLISINNNYYHVCIGCDIGGSEHIEDEKLTGLIKKNLGKIQIIKGHEYFWRHVKKILI